MVTHKKKQKVDEPIMAMMREKTANFTKMTETIQAMAAAPPPSLGVAQEESAEHLYALSLVPHLKRMDDDTRDLFMCHVFKIAMKAVRGMWPPEKSAE